MTNPTRDEPDYLRAFLIRLATVPLIFAIVAALVFTLYLITAGGYSYFIVYASLLLYAGVWAAPLSLLTYYLWRRAGRVDQTWPDVEETDKSNLTVGQWIIAGIFTPPGALLLWVLHRLDVWPKPRIYFAVWVVGQIVVVGLMVVGAAVSLSTVQ